MKPLKFILVIIVLLLAILSGYYVYQKNQPITLMFSAEELQALLAPHFPLKANKFIFEFKIDKPVIILKEESTDINIGAEVDIHILEQKTITGYIELTGNIHYHRNQGSLVFASPHVTSIEMPDIPGNLGSEIEALIQDIIQEDLTGIAFYPVQENNVAQSTDTLSLNEIHVNEGIMYIILLPKVSSAK